MNWLLKEGLVLVAYRGEGEEWTPWCVNASLVPHPRELNTIVDWCAGTLWHDGTVVIVRKPKGKKRWEEVEKFMKGTKNA